jgi:hypothetical protein
LLHTRCAQGPLDCLSAAERAETVDADGLLVSGGDRPVITRADVCSPTR